AVALGLDGVSLDVVDGGILLTPEVAGGAASIENGSLTSSGSRELMVHNYAVPGGSFGIGASITGAVDVTFSGTGLTVLSTNNSYTGITRINGGTVQIDNANQLGSVATNLEMRGGTLFTTANMALSNRVVLLGGDGGTFRVAAGTTNVIGSVLSESNYLSSTRLNNGHGDLIKTGPGTLHLASTPGATNNLIAGYNMYQGLTDVREGVLRVVATNNFGLGSSKSFYDGTIVRGGATLALGSNGVVQYNMTEWLMFEQGSKFRVETATSGYQSMQMNGVIDFRGDTTIEQTTGDFFFNGSGAGYIMGAGDIIKDGDAALNIQEYSPEYTGDIIVKDGTFRLYGGTDNPLPNAGSITIGLNDTVDRGGVVFYSWLTRDGTANEWNVDQDITVQGRSGDTRLGVHRYNHNDVVNYNGDIDLTNFGTNGWTVSEFRLTAEDDLGERSVNGADAMREDLYMNLTGDITGGDKRIRTMLGQSYYSGGGYDQSHDRGNQITNEMNMMVFFTLTGSNTGWTGSLEVGNRPGAVSSRGLDFNGPDQDKQHFMRFGNNDGLATLAIGASNGVVLRHDATLQAYGSQVTIGNLFSDG
ncbi:MAG: autotransporter-associated beta strand repeat-containing protein, partial [Candidatus Hydrogenedentes bacterium]|nr:autotransporter-associated beta strand repeat-containing protein [Candidatus Hydrogenedentota bacterium]